MKGTADWAHSSKIRGANSALEGRLIAVHWSRTRPFKAYSLDVYEDTAFTAVAENMAILKQMLSAEATSLSFSTSAEALTGLTIGYEGFLDAYNCYQQTQRS